MDTSSAKGISPAPIAFAKDNTLIDQNTKSLSSLAFDRQKQKDVVSSNLPFPKAARAYSVH
jgi:hypothetical protein